MWRVLKNVLYVQAWPNYMKGIFDLNKFGIRTIIWLFWIIFSCGGYPRLSPLWIGVLIDEWLVAAAVCWLCDSPCHCCFSQIFFILDQFMFRYLWFDYNLSSKWNETVFNASRRITIPIRPSLIHFCSKTALV